MADSECATNSFSTGHDEANSVWYIAFHCGLSPDAAGPSFETLHGFHGHGNVPVDPSCRGIERSWPLLSTQEYIDAVLTHGRDIETFLANMTP